MAQLNYQGKLSDKIIRSKLGGGGGGQPIFDNLCQLSDLAIFKI